MCSGTTGASFCGEELTHLSLYLRGINEFPTIASGWMAERSKALDSSSISLTTSGSKHSSEETLVGSNPTPINSFLFSLFFCLNSL